MLGYTAVESGEVTKIIPLSEGRYAATPVNPSQFPETKDELMVQVVSVQNISATKLVVALRPLIAEFGTISAYEPGNSLILSGTVGNIERLVSIIRSVDRLDNNEVEVIRLQHATANKVAEVISKLQGTDNEKTMKIGIAADVQSNSVLISGDRQARIKARIVISQLDTQTFRSNQGNTQVIPLHYQKAKDLAPILNKVVSGQEQSDTTPNIDKEKIKINIEAEPSTNALIITAPKGLMESLKEVVRNLDSRPQQVLVEAAIVEVDDRMRTQLGIQWGQLNREGTGNDANDTSTSGNALPTGFNPGIGVIKNGNLREVIFLLAQDASADILSTPSLMVLDNQQAKIEVGKTLSIETGSYASTNGENNSVNPFTTFNRENIGLHLYVTPQIDSSGAIKLNIDQGNESLEDPVDPGTTPVTNNTSLKTTVIVNNSDVLVLGGLISNLIRESDIKVPIVSDIPIFGELFKYKSHRYEKRTLMIFLKPTIVSTPKEQLTVTRDRYDFIRNEQLVWENRDKHALPDQQYRILPSWDEGNTPNLPKPFTDSLTLPPPHWARHDYRF